MAEKKCKFEGHQVVKTTEQFVLVIRDTGKRDWKGPKYEYFLCPSMNDAKVIFGSSTKQYVTMMQVASAVDTSIE